MNPSAVFTNVSESDLAFGEVSVSGRLEEAFAKEVWTASRNY